MRSTGEFQIHQYFIDFDKFNEPIYIIPFGDVHRYAPMCAEEKWLETLEWGKKKERCYWLGMGDYLDLISASERKVIEDKSLHDSTSQTLDKMVRKMVKDFSDEISFMKGRLIGLVEGNHFWQYPSGITSTQNMCDALDTKYLGTSALIRINFTQKRRKCTRSLDIIVHHGRGSSRVSGGGLKPVQTLADMCQCDIALMGDDHKKELAFNQKLCLTQGNGVLNLRSKTILIARTGSFLKGWVPGERSYVVDSQYTPTDLGLIKIEITPKRQQINGSDLVDLDIHASI